MPRTTLILLALALATAPMALGAPDVPPQDDGGSGDDASDVCTGDLVVLQIDGDALDGELYPPHDNDDFYALEVDSDDVGDEFTVSLSGHHDMEIGVFMPDCGRNVVPTLPNGKAGAGHDNDKGKGHVRCSARGHAADAICDTEQGSDDGMGSVTFTPSQEGQYYVQISIAPNAENGGGKGGDDPPEGDEVVIFNCHAGCMTYSVLSSRSGGTEIS